VKRAIALAAAAGVLAALAGVAEARNPHCAGGIQYLNIGMNDKNKGNMEDYQREIGKAVDQLTQCTQEDTLDLEALGYLGWALAEVDSSRAAGVAFERAIAALRPKDPKKADWAAQNRDSYWATAFNDGIAKINSAQGAYPDFVKKPENDADRTLQAEARKNYALALRSLTRASLLKPGDTKTVRSLGSVYAFMGQFETAEATFREGLAFAPRDTALLQSLKNVRANFAGQLIEEKKYDQAIGFFNELIKADPNSSDLQLGLADAYFKRAQSKEGDARKPDFKSAGDAYAAAARLKPGDADLTFNAALAYQNGGATNAAEPLWRETLKLRPEDMDAISALGSCLADLGKFDEAIQVLWDGISREPKNKVLHRQLGAVYTKAGNNQKSTEELMVYLSLARGAQVPDLEDYLAFNKRPAGSAAAKLLETAGKPDQIMLWGGSDSQSATYRIEQFDVTKDAKTVKITKLPPDNSDIYESWFYWTKKQAYHFKGGVQQAKSDWSAPASKPAGGAAPSGSANKK
jgi:tetratricopeptide (TPR) repeat protein